jgi:hypothetical protein
MLDYHHPGGNQPPEPRGTSRRAKNFLVVLRTGLAKQVTQILCAHLFVLRQQFELFASRPMVHMA